MAELRLVLETEPDQRTVCLRLRDAHDRHLGSSQVAVAAADQYYWEGLFDTRRHVRLYEGSRRDGDDAAPSTAEELLVELGVFLGRKVLGAEIMQALAGNGRRTLVVRLPTLPDPFSAAFARVPWEIARAAPGEPPLMERNVVVRAASAATPAADLGADGGEPLRVLLVFAEAPGSRPLAMRLEREELLEIFRREILPRRRVEVDVLCHGVTRGRLRDQIERRRGYHVIHWSGHGDRNRLALHPEGDDPPSITGGQLVDLLVEAGGFTPRLFFLSACLSGALVNVKDWESLRAAMAEAAGAASPGRAAGERELGDILEQDAGYTSTALALLGAGVPQVVAMRYEVGDAYARELAVRFYRLLLAADSPYPAEDALAQARADLCRLRDRGDSRGRAFHAVDHATPLIVRAAGRPLPLRRGRSAQLDRARPRPQPLLGGSRDLDPPERFVGRGAELTRLAVEWLAGDGHAVALVQGLAGLGKTAIAAEAIHLWHSRFDWVFAFQSRGHRLPLEELLRALDARLAQHSAVYRARCEEDAAARLSLEPSPSLTGAARTEQMRYNLREALRDEAILLVLDNFETNLEALPGPEGYACQDPEWDSLLRFLAAELRGTPSRLLVTSRHRPAALAGEDALWLPLGPLPLPEAALFIQDHDGLHALYYGGDEGRELVERLLAVSRGHPLILSRLAALARDPGALAAALERIRGEGWRALPDLFAGAQDDAARRREHDYLQDVAVGAIDLLIERASPDARRLLWVLTRAFEPVPKGLLSDVWSSQGETAPIGPLIASLHGAGILSIEGEGSGAAYAFHELVRERVDAWMAAHAEERGGRTEEEVWVAYGERYAATFQALRASGRPGAMSGALEAGRRALTYLARARDFERLGSFVGRLVSSTREPSLLHGMLTELCAVAEESPPGKRRWSARTYLADALSRSGRSQLALPLYEQAAVEAEAAASWNDVGWICHNWANALRDTGSLDAAKAAYRRSADAQRRAGSPDAYIVGAALEALRVDVIQGAAGQILPEIERRLVQVRGWWNRYRAGMAVPEAPDPVILERVIIGALDVARAAAVALERWQVCLDILGEMEEVERTWGEREYDMTLTRYNRWAPLLSLGRMDEAQRVIESCLPAFRGAQDLIMEARALSALADLWHARGNFNQAVELERQALVLRNRLPNPEDRGASHTHVSIYLERAGRKEVVPMHHLAALIYDVAAGLGQDLGTDLHNLGVRTRRARAAGEVYSLPRVADLLGRPEFDALRRFLEARGDDPAALQAQVDALEAQVRQDVGATNQDV